MKVIPQLASRRAVRPLILLALLLCALDAGAQNIFVTLVERQASVVDPRGIKIKAPGKGWKHSAVAPVKGEVWNMLQRPDPLINGNRTGTAGDFPLPSLYRLPLVDSKANETTVEVIVGITISSLADDTARMEPETMTGAVGKLAPSGLMDEGWRMFSDGNTATLIVSGLKPSMLYDLFFYGADERGHGAAFELLSETPTRTVETGSDGGEVFHYNEKKKIEPVPAGETWVHARTLANADGVIAFKAKRNSRKHCFFNGFQIIEAKE